jgi:hypothetical protein
VTLDQNNKAERAYEMKLAYLMQARITDVNNTGLQDIQINVKRDSGLGVNRTIATNMTDMNGVFTFMSTEPLFMVKDILYFEIVDPTNKYQGTTVNTTITAGQT